MTSFLEQVYTVQIPNYNATVGKWKMRWLLVIPCLIYKMVLSPILSNLCKSLYSGFSFDGQNYTLKTVSSKHKLLNIKNNLAKSETNVSVISSKK